MSTPNQTTALGIVKCTYTDMIASLSPSANSLVSLARYLVDADLIATDTVTSIERCESTVESQEVLVSVLLSLGMGKFTKVKEAIRNFSKDHVKSSETEPNSSPVPKPRTRSPKPIDALSSTEEARDTSKHRKPEKHELYAKMQTFSILFYTIIQKLVHSYSHSTTVRQRLSWLRQNINPTAVSDFFPTSALTGLNDVTDESINVSMETLMESYKQVWKHVQREIREEKKKGKEQASEDRKKDKDQVVDLTAQNKELLMINKQWAIECEEKDAEILQLQSEVNALRTAQTSPTCDQEEVDQLRMTISELTSQLQSGAETIEGYKDTIEELKKERSLSRESREDNYVLKLQELQAMTYKCSNLENKLAKSEDKVSEYEKLLLECVNREAHHEVVAEREEMKQQLEAVLQDQVDQREKITALEEEQRCLQETNEALLKDLEALRKESEEDKNYIEELKDQVSNLRLNAKMREPSVREMSELLAKNRDLDNQVHKLEEECQKLRDDNFVIQDRHTVLSEEKEKLKKQLSSAKDELMAYKTHLQELRGASEVENHTSSRHSRRTEPSNGYYRQRELALQDLKTPPGVSRHASRGQDQETNDGLASFRSQQRTCPVCNKVFLKLSEQDFTHHVASCFK